MQVAQVFIDDALVAVLPAQVQVIERFQDFIRLVEEDGHQFLVDRFFGFSCRRFRYSGRRRCRINQSCDFFGHLRRFDCHRFGRFDCFRSFRSSRCRCQGCQQLLT